MTKCKDCGAEIIWIKTKAGKNMPCDATPIWYIADPAGKGRLVTEAGETIRCTFAENTETATGWGYIPHWSTCPAAEHFRRNKQK